MFLISDSPTYRRFAKERNRALVKILERKLIRISLILDEVKDVCLDVGVRALSYTGDLQSLRRLIHQRLEQIFYIASEQLSHIAIDLRKITYVLSYASEAEALGRAMNSKASVSLSYNDISQAMLKPAPSGGALSQRINHIMETLQRDVAIAIEKEFLTGGSHEDMADALNRVFPRKRRYKRPTSPLKGPALKEAKQERLITGFIDHDTWQEVVQEYLSDFIPTERGPKGVIKIKFGQTVYERYDWDLERELTEDFVARVAQGKEEAAKKNGITDFVWIAIIDDKTDDCCAWRDGLTVSEIERQLKGKMKNDKCQAITPPAHFNCRCDLAPISSIEPEAGEPLGDFETWLKS